MSDAGPMLPTGTTRILAAHRPGEAIQLRVRRPAAAMQRCELRLADARARE